MILFAHKLLERAKYKCQFCGVAHRRTYVFTRGQKPYLINDSEVNEFKEPNNKVYKVFLQVHHIDGNRQNNEHSNLIVLCPACHFREERAKASLKRISSRAVPYGEMQIK